MDTVQNFHHAIPTGLRRKLAIVSTYDELCGIAGYTRAIETQLRERVDVTVFDLDQFLLRSQHRVIQKLADAHIKEIADQLRGFDSVNIQLEHGTLGRNPQQIIRRFKRLANAAPNLSVTFHTVLMREGFPWDILWRTLRSARFSAASDTIGNYRRGIRLTGTIYSHLRRLQSRKHVSTIFHTSRDARLIRILYKIKNVHHHPLSFIQPERAAQIRQETSREDFPILTNIPAGAKLIGTFGFLSPYKGFETAVRALSLLPEDYHLLIFGGVHPQSIKREQIVDPYIRNIIRVSGIGRTVMEEIVEKGVQTSPQGVTDLLREHPGSLRGRMHFLGALPDHGFAKAMAVCDAVVLPYLEVGQSSSGPIAMATEMGARVIASRTNAFMRYSKYHPGEIEFFDIGNYVELAGRIMAPAVGDSSRRNLKYTTATNVDTYMEASGFSDLFLAGDEAPAPVQEPVTVG